MSRRPVTKSERTLIQLEQPPYRESLRPTPCVKPRFGLDLVKITSSKGLYVFFCFVFFLLFHLKMAFIVKKADEYKHWRACKTSAFGTIIASLVLKNPAEI